MPIIATGSNSINISARVGVVVKEGMRSRSSASDVLPLQFTTQPQSQSVVSGNQVTFTCVVAGGYSHYSYQWKRDGVNIAGATSSSYSFTSVANDNGKSYSVAVTDFSGNTIISDSAILSVSVLLAFTSQPQAKTVDEYSLATFSASVTGGTAPYMYQWKKNGTNVGTNSANLSFTAATADNSASISVVVTDSVGTVITSSAVALGVTSYAFNFDGVTQYVQLSGNGIPVTASTSLIKLAFIGKNVTGNFKKFIESDERNFYIDSGSTGTTFRISNCTVKMDGVSISSGTTIPISGKHTLEITPLNSGTIKTISSRGSGDLGNLPLYNFSVLSSGTVVNTIPLNNKSQGANQLATVGSINATIVNYNAAGWTAI